MATTKTDSFETCLAELEKLLSTAENNEIENLEQFLKNYETAADLILKCEKKLNDATLRVQKINETLGNTNITKPNNSDGDM